MSKSITKIYPDKTIIDDENIIVRFNLDDKLYQLRIPLEVKGRVRAEDVKCLILSMEQIRDELYTDSNESMEDALKRLIKDEGEQV